MREYVLVGEKRALPSRTVLILDKLILHRLVRTARIQQHDLRHARQRIKTPREFFQLRVILHNYGACLYRTENLHKITLGSVRATRDVCCTKRLNTKARVEPLNPIVGNQTNAITTTTPNAGQTRGKQANMLVKRGKRSSFKDS